ncbi:MAG: 4'-phosphopantetheinyl transferase superfamily protein [Myxococcales bacterium]|nr:4'-phosphopantetheinyl transferase superfamily protein [Myxococcales bacterium]
MVPSTPGGIPRAAPLRVPPFALGADELHLWCTDPGAVAAPAHLAACEALLGDDERQRRDAFVLPTGRHEQLVTRALVRTLLGRYLGVAPKALRFAPNPWGRPELVWPGRAPVTFNLAHARGLVVCLLAAAHDGRAVGVDVENVVRRTPPLHVADHFFAPAEVEALAARPPDARGRRFFELWTLKESYIKARGMGLAIPLDGFAFELDAAPSIRIDLRPDVGSDAGAWRFRLHEPTPEHLVAIAVRDPRPRDLRLCVAHAAPLAGPLAG